MLDMTPNTDIRELLRTSIRHIKQQKPNLSSSALAVQLDIASSTLGRIENAEVKRPDIKHAISIVKAAYGEETAKRFTETYYAEVLRKIDSIYRGNKNVPFLDEDAEKYFRDPAFYELMVMATSEAGVTRETVRIEFGNKGLAALDDLIANEVLIETDGVYGIKGNINATQGTVHKLVSNLIGQNYDIDAFGKKSNWLSLQYESVNMETALPVIKDIMEKASAEIRVVLNDPAYKGKDVLWAAMSTDSLKKQGSQEVLQ